MWYGVLAAELIVEFRVLLDFRFVVRCESCSSCPGLCDPAAVLYCTNDNCDAAAPSRVPLVCCSAYSSTILQMDNYYILLWCSGCWWAATAGVHHYERWGWTRFSKGGGGACVTYSHSWRDPGVHHRWWQPAPPGVSTRDTHKMCFTHGKA